MFTVAGRIHRDGICIRGRRRFEKRLTQRRELHVQTLIVARSQNFLGEALFPVDNWDNVVQQPLDEP